MVQTAKIRKTRSDKFPLTLHPTGQFCKKIKGKLYYFGKDKSLALQSYLEQAVCLHTGQKPKLGSDNNNLTLKWLCNMYLESQEARAMAGEIKPRQIHDQRMLLRRFVKYIGLNRKISDISTLEMQNYRQKLIREGKANSTINNHISAFKAVFNWAQVNEVVSSIPNLKAIKKITAKKQTRQTFTVAQIKELLKHANVSMKAMIWLGLNCAFGCTDCAELTWKHVDLKNARINFPRPKSGVERNLPLWAITVQALMAINQINERVFNTKQGNSYVRVTQKISSDGVQQSVFANAITKEFSKLLIKAKISVEKGTGFYTLRRTAATLAAQSGDPFAVQRLLGHADLKMASTYVQDVSEQTDRVINNTCQIIIQDGS